MNLLNTLKFRRKQTLYIVKKFIDIEYMIFNLSVVF